jgi:AcrR family transcriptional regulator
MNSKPGKPARGRPKTLNKDHVTDVAMRAYWEDGPTEVSLNEVCARAGVSKPSVYREFGNDDGLACAALQSYAENVLSEMLAIIDGVDTVAEKIRQIAYLSAASPLHENGCLFVKMRAVKSQMGPKTQALIEQIESLALDAFTRLLTEGGSSGEWSNGITIELGAKYLHAQIGLALDQRARGQDPRPVLELALSVLDNPKTKMR